MQEPGIKRITKLEDLPDAKAVGQSEEDLIVTYYKLRQELEDLKVKKAAKK